MARYTKVANAQKRLIPFSERCLWEILESILGNIMRSICQDTATAREFIPKMGNIKENKIGIMGNLFLFTSVVVLQKYSRLSQDPNTSHSSTARMLY